MRPIALVLTLLVTACVSAQPRGIIGRPAPVWGVTKWMNLPAGAHALDIGDFKGRVLYLYGFQSWCPGCHSHGFPTLQGLIDHYRGVDDVAFVAVQTVFEGYASNTFDHARDVAAQYALDIPVGQSGEEGERSPLMNRYRTGGTPWTIIIDRHGIVRFNDFRITQDRAVSLIDRLVAENRPVHRLPESRIGKALLGTALDLSKLDWIHPKQAPVVHGKVTLVRWFTDNCHFCKTSLPAIMKLDQDIAHADFQTVAVYHAKPPRKVAHAEIATHAKVLGYSGPLAADSDWTHLQALYLEHHPKAVTSVTFVMDRAGKIRYIHPGPVFGSSSTDAVLNREYNEVRSAVQALLEGE